MLKRYAQGGLLRRFLTAMLAILLSSAASAQSPGKGKQLEVNRFQRIALDRSDPEVQAIERRRPLGFLQSHASPSDSRFLVDLDPSKGNTFARNPSARLSDMYGSAASRKTISYDRTDGQATELVIEYPTLNAQLRCYWSYNQRLYRLLSAADAKAREAALEREARRSADNPQRAVANSTGDGRKLSKRSEILLPGDPEMGTLIRARRQFKRGGRPCQIEVVCMSKVSNHEKFVKRHRLFQKERQACMARADQLAAATRIIRTGE